MEMATKTCKVQATPAADYVLRSHCGDLSSTTLSIYTHCVDLTYKSDEITINNNVFIIL